MKYWRARVERLSEKLKKRREYWEMQAQAILQSQFGGLPINQDEALKELKELQSQVRAASKQLKEAESALADFMPRAATGSWSVEAAKNKEAASAFLSSIKGIRV